MRPYARQDIGYNPKKDKLSTQPHPQAQWVVPSGHMDKTFGFHSRTSYKRIIRNAKRAQNKSTRQRLKLSDMAQA